MLQKEKSIYIYIALKITVICNFPFHLRDISCFASSVSFILVLDIIPSDVLLHLFNCVFIVGLSIKEQIISRKKKNIFRKRVLNCI